MSDVLGDNIPSFDGGGNENQEVGLSNMSALADTGFASNWKEENGRFTWAITIPANTTATVHLPTGRQEEVREGSAAAAKARGVTFLRREKDRALYRVGSGSYVFSCPLPDPAS